MKDARYPREPGEASAVELVDGFTLFAAATYRAGTRAELGDVATPPERPPLTIGSQINGRYSIVRVIGHGGMGWVYDVGDAVHPERSVALKLVADLARTAELATMFEAEFRTMSQLEHPNVARVYDFEQIQGSTDCVITMERIDGLPLDQAPADPRDWRTASDYIVQTCRALSYVHSRGIVHHDLKPGNIMVQSDGSVRVIDFGIARDATRANAGYPGTPLYMAPEVHAGAAHVDHRADLYSLGVTLHELLVGEVPCPKRRPFEVAAWALTNDVALPESCAAPDWLRDVVRKLCARDPAERFRSANAVIEAIRTGSGIAHELETAETRQSYILTPRFSGRQFEQAQVMSFLAGRLRGDRGEPALLVSGVSGIGKSRLMREVRLRAQLERVVFLESNCYEANPAEYRPIADLLLQLVPLLEQLNAGDIVTRALPELVRMAPELRRGRQVVEPPRAATAEDERARMLEVTSAFLVGAAGVVPFVVYINDLQWAGSGPAQVFAHLAERVRDDEAHGRIIPLALLGSYRSDETEGRPCGELLKRVRGERTAIDLALRPLEPGEVGDIIQSMLGVDDVPRQFLERAAAETAGNPFFVQELMRVLLEDGTVYLEAGRWMTLGSIGELPIPASIADVFRRRFQLLGQREQNVLCVLAVQARPMSLELLGSVLGDIHAVPRATRELMDRGLVAHADGRRVACVIGHDRMRETIYADLSDDERRGWHRRLGETIEARSQTGADAEQPLDELAHHFWHAAAFDRALEYAMPAGMRCMAQYANQAALEHFEHALALLDPADERHTRMFEHRADMLVRLANYDAALEYYHELLRGLAGQPLAEARVHGKLADIHMQRSELELAVEYGWKALRVWGEKSPSSKLGWAIATGSLFARFALERLGFATPKRSAADLAYKVAAYDKLFRAYFFLDPLRTFYCTLRLWRLTAISDDYEAMACAKSGVAMMIGVAGMRRWAFELFAEARRDADTANSSWWRGTVEMRRSVVSRMDGRWDVEPLDEAIEALRDAGDMFDLGAAVFHAAEVCFQKGCIDEAFERARAFNAATSRVEPGAPPSVVGSRIMEAICRVLRGEPDLGRFEHEYGVALSRKDIIVRTSVLHEWADGLVATGRLEEAVQTLEDAYRLWKKHRLIDAYTSQLLFKLPRAYLALPQLDRRQLRQLRRAHHEALRKTRRRHVGWRAPTLVNQALLLERAGKRAKADVCFQKAIDLARRQNAGLFVAKGLYEWGVMLSARGDAAAGAARLHEALHLAEAGGNVWLATLCRSALPRASD